MEFTLRIGKYELTNSYANDRDRIGIYIENNGEGADFLVEALEAVIDKFYKENF